MRPDEIFRLSRARRISRISIWMSFDYRTDFAFCALSRNSRIMNRSPGCSDSIIHSLWVSDNRPIGSYLEIGAPVDHTQQAGPSQGWAAWGYLLVDFVFKHTHGFPHVSLAVPVCGKNMGLWVLHVPLAVPACETLPICVVGSAGVWEEYVYCLESSHMSLAVPVYNGVNVSVFSKWAQHRDDDGKKTGFDLDSGGFRGGSCQLGIKALESCQLAEQELEVVARDGR
ncbi:unnamed protein product [Prunus armeniaca]